MSIKTTYTSLFDIPEIVDYICDNLSRIQLAACLQVSRSWNDIFSPQISRFVKFSNPTSKESQAILRRAALIRSLEIDIFDGAWFLDPVVPCTNLRRLYCVDMNDMDDIEHSPTDNLPTTNALMLLDKNPQLQILHVEQKRYFGNAIELPLAALKCLSTHPSLTQITVRGVFSPADFLSVLVHHLPSTVQDFEFSVQSYNDNSPWPNPGQLLLSQWDYSRNSLRRIILRSDHWGTWWGHELDWRSILWYYSDCLEESMVTPLVAKSHLLREFCVSDFKGDPRVLLQTLTESCPDLEIVTIHGINNVHRQPPNNDLSETTAASIAYNSSIPLKGRLTKLREFRMYIWNDSQSQVDYQHVADWLLRSAATLEVVEFEMNDRNSSLIQYPWSLQPQYTNSDSRDDFHVWTDCSRLKKFRIRMREYWVDFCSCCSTDHDDECDPRPPQYLPKSLLEDLVRPSSVWQCTELESLDLLVRDTAPPPLPLPGTDINILEPNSNPEQELVLLAQEKTEQARWKFAEEIGQLFWRLKNLSKLTNISLRWTLSEDVSTMALEDLLAMINSAVVEDEGEKYKHSQDKAGSCREIVVTQDDLTWLGLGSVFWTRLDIELYTKELEAFALAEALFQLPPPHEFDNTEHPLHRRVGHAWKDWDVFTRANDKIDFTYTEDPLESMAQFEAMSKKFESKDGSWRRRTKKNRGGCLSGW